MKQKIRIWKLGSLEHKILPTKEAVEKLAGIVLGWDRETTLDLVWGPDLELVQLDVDSNTIDLLVTDGAVRLPPEPKTKPNRLRRLARRLFAWRSV